MPFITRYSPISRNSCCQGRNILGELGNTKATDSRQDISSCVTECWIHGFQEQEFKYLCYRNVKNVEKYEYDNASSKQIGP